MAVSLILAASLFSVVSVDPDIIRVTPDPGSTVTREVRVTPGTTILAIEAPCPCVRATDALPASADHPLRLTIAGVLPGVKPIVIRTTDGEVRMTLIIDTAAGAASGIAVVDRMASLHPRGRVLLVADRITGQPQNCGCSTGSLGGVDVLAALPAALRSRGLEPQAVLTGPVPTTVAALLGDAGWRFSPPEVPVWTGDGMPWMIPGVRAVVARGPSPNHQRILHPRAGGLVVEAAVMDAMDRIVTTYQVPIDASLPRIDPPAQAHVSVMDRNLAGHCASCHPDAVATWQASAHAASYQHLPETARTASCVPCHITERTPGGDPALGSAGVSCQACHLGSDAHGISGGSQRTTGLVDCRSCHDVAHHPSFDRASAWMRIRHGKTSGGTVQDR